MVVMAGETIKRSYELSVGIAEALDTWNATTRVQKGAAVELGLWIVLSMDAQTREDCLRAMDEGVRLVPGSVSVALPSTGEGEPASYGGSLPDPAAVEEAGRKALAAMRDSKKPPRRRAEGA